MKARKTTALAVALLLGPSLVETASAQRPRVEAGVRPPATVDISQGEEETTPLKAGRAGPLRATKMPDLTCTATASPYLSGEEPIAEGEEIRLGGSSVFHTVTLRNRGHAPSGEFDVRIDIRQDGEPTAYTRFNDSVYGWSKGFASLGPGESCVVAIRTGLTEGGPSEVEAAVLLDVGRAGANSVVESHEGNNECGIRFTAVVLGVRPDSSAFAGPDPETFADYYDKEYCETEPNPLLPDHPEGDG